MKRYYKHIGIYYKGYHGIIEFRGSVFTGVQFKDEWGQVVKTSKEYFYRKYTGDEFQLTSTETSDVCGTKTDTSSGWMSLLGPIKGSYVIKNYQDSDEDYISDFGLRIEDPCQAKNNKQNIDLTPGQTSVKDLKYHQCTDSQFWQTKVC